MKKLIIILLILSGYCFAGEMPAPPPSFIYNSVTGNYEPAISGAGINAPISVSNGTITLPDGTDTHTIKAVQETGLGGRLTFGLDETARTMMICDAGDVDIDFGLGIRVNPSLIIPSALTTSFLRLDYGKFYSTNNTLFTFGFQSQMSFQFESDVDAGNMCDIKSISGKELTDTNGEQSWIYVEPKINQSGTAAYNGLKINVTETATGDGTAGQGNNLIWAGVAGTKKFEVDNTGIGYFAGALTAASYIDNTPGYAGDALSEIALIKTVAGEIDHDTLPAFAHIERIQRDKSTAQRIEVTKTEAFEEYQADVPTFDLVDKADTKTGKVKTAKIMRIKEYKITGYAMAEDSTVTTQTEPVYETKKETKQRIKEGYEFDSNDGKFYKKGVVTITEKVVPGRDLGAMISILTVAVQQLTERIEMLEASGHGQ